MSTHPVFKETWSHLAQVVVSEMTLSDLLEQVAVLAQSAIPQVVDASVTLVHGDRAYTAAFTGRTALTLDERQYESGYGPCLDAADTGDVVQIVDTSRAETYPAFVKDAAAHDIRSTLSIGLPLRHDVHGALNLYSRTPGRFDLDTVETAKGFAIYAAIALTNVSLYEDALAVGENLRSAMESRGVIEQAKGILIAEHGCDADEAFRILSRMSQNANRKVRDVAAELVHKRSRRGRAV